MPSLLASSASRYLGARTARRRRLGRGRFGRPLLAVCLLAGLGLSATPAQATFPGPNGPIAFQTGGFGQPNNVWVINPDGSGLNQLTGSGDRAVVSGQGDPHISPDGREIAFSHEPQREDPEIYLMNADGSGQTNLTKDPNSRDLWPSWSPDGSQIAYYCSGDICVINSDGTGKRKLTEDSVPFANTDVRPNWSPDGSKITFTRSGQDTCFDSEVFVVNADGTNLTRLTKDRPLPFPSPPGSPSCFREGRSVFDEYPSFSPDGTRIVWNRTFSREIWVMDATDANGDGFGDNAAPLRDDTGNLRSQSYHPVFSPDGTKLAFKRFDEETDDFQIFLMNSNGSGELTRVTTVSGLTLTSALDWGRTLRLPPSVSISDATVTEGDAGTSNLTFTVSLSEPAGRLGLSVGFATADGTASARGDYSGKSGVVSFARGESSKTVTVPVKGDTLEEANETLFVNLSDVEGTRVIADGQALGTILDDDRLAAASAAGPRATVSGVPRACTSRSFRTRVSVSGPAPVQRVRVYLDGRRIASSTRASFTVRVRTSRLRRGSRHRLTVLATDSAGRTTRGTSRFRVCAAQRRPRFTG